MPTQGLNPGDRVVDLAALVVSVAVATGAVTGAWLVWLIKRGWLAAAAAFVVGAVIGFVLGSAIAHVSYRTGDRATTVVKVGSASLASTIRAGLLGGLGTSIGIALVALWAFRTTSPGGTLFRVAIGCGVGLGLLFACVASLA
jgi:hypothetical protein